MSQEKQFYVYVHRYASGPKQGEVFYVGKGKGRRYTRSTSRSAHWNRIVNKYGFTAHIITHFKNEKCAFSFERALIAFYGRDNLCNLTDGGEGTGGRIVSNETRIKASNSNYRDTHYMRGRKLTEEQRQKISAGMIGKPRGPMVQSHKHAISIAKKMARNGNFKNELLLFCHTDGLCIITTQNYMMNEIGLDKGNLSRLISGQIKSSKGWVVYDL